MIINAHSIFHDFSTKFFGFLVVSNAFGKVDEMSQGEDDSDREFDGLGPPAGHILSHRHLGCNKQEGTRPGPAMNHRFSIFWVESFLFFIIFNSTSGTSWSCMYVV